LASITIPNNVTSIGSEAFSNCSSLTSVNIPNSLESLEIRVFCGCSSLKSVTIPNSVTKIRDAAFIHCSGLTSITIPNSVKSIGENVFDYCSSLTSVSIGNGVTSIEQSAFHFCEKLPSIIIPSSVTSIGYSVLGGCFALTSVVVDSENPVYDSRDNCNAIIKTADNELIAGCKNTIITISVTRIGERSFEDCETLSSITLPNSVSSIGYYAFQNCSGLNTIISYIQEPFALQEGQFSVYSTATLYVPHGTKDMYETTEGWNQFENIVEMDAPEGIEIDEVNFPDEIFRQFVLDNCDTDKNGFLTEDEISAVLQMHVNGMSQDIFGEDFKDVFTGIVFKVAPGKGSVRIEAQTTGSMVLKVKIGDSEPITKELDDKQKVTVPYNVEEETYVYVYGGNNASQARPKVKGMSKADANDGELRIYGIEVESNTTPTDIDGINQATITEHRYYNLNGQQVNAPQKGLYITDGKKVVVK